MVSLLCNWFTDWGRSIKAGLGEGWLIALVVVFSFIALCLFQNIFRASIGKTKFVFKWFQIIVLVILILFIIWFCTLL